MRKDRSFEAYGERIAPGQRTSPLRSVGRKPMRRARPLRSATSTTMMRRAPDLVALLLCPFFVAACATGFTESDVDDFGSFRIDVTNDLAPRVEVYLQVDPESGGGGASETLLGNAPVEGTTVFRIDLENPAAPHRLRAALPRNAELLSEAFVPTELAGVRWVLADNVLNRVEGREAESEREEAGEEAPGSEHRRPTGARLIPPGR